MPKSPIPSASLARYCTIQQAAAALAVDTKTIRRMISRGELSAVKIGNRTPGTARDNRTIRIPADALNEILHPVILGFVA